MTKQTSKGISFYGLLAIVFIALKLCKVINWSWILVLTPIWIPAAISLFSFIIFTYKFTKGSTGGRQRPFPPERPIVNKEAL